MQESKKTETRLSQEFIQAAEAFLSLVKVKRFTNFLSDTPLPSHSLSGLTYKQIPKDFKLLIKMLEKGAKEKKRLKLRNKHWKKA